MTKSTGHTSGHEGKRECSQIATTLIRTVSFYRLGVPNLKPNTKPFSNQT